MQHTRNRTFMWIQDIILVSVLPLLCFFCLGSIRIGSWHTGDIFMIDGTAYEGTEDWIEDFYANYPFSAGDELGETPSYGCIRIWSDVFGGIHELSDTLQSSELTLRHFQDLPEKSFSKCAGLLFFPHIISVSFSDTIFQGISYAALFCLTAILPLIVLNVLGISVVTLLTQRQNHRERHRKIVLLFRKACLPLFFITALILVTPGVLPADGYWWAVGILLAVLLWNTIASRVKNNTSNEKEFLNFIQSTSFAGAIFMVCALLTFVISTAPGALHDRIRYSDGIEILINFFTGDPDIAEFLMVLFTLTIFITVGIMVRYVYYTLLRFSCLLEASPHKDTSHEGLLISSIVSLGGLAASYFLFEAAGHLKLRLEDTEKTIFTASLVFLLLVIIVEGIQRFLCYLNRLDREYRNDLLCGCTEDRIYSEFRDEDDPAEDTSGNMTKSESSAESADQTDKKDTPPKDTEDLDYIKGIDVFYFEPQDQ